LRAFENLSASELESADYSSSKFDPGRAIALTAMQPVIIILSDSEDDCALQEQRQRQLQQGHHHEDVMFISPLEPPRPACSAAAVSNSSSAGNSGKSYSLVARSPVIIVPGTPPTPFAPDAFAPTSTLPLQLAAAENRAGAVAVDELNCRYIMRRLFLFIVFFL
jgi:hypothetical protein